jgi:hypothetical protein
MSSLLIYLWNAIKASLFLGNPFQSSSPSVEEQSRPEDQPFSFCFPSQFVLKDLIAITSPEFELKWNPLQDKARASVREWFLTYALHRMLPCPGFIP